MSEWVDLAAVILVAVAVATVYYLARRRYLSRPVPRPEAAYIIAVDADHVESTHPDGTRETVRWDDLIAVWIDTNDTGPWGIDVWWVLMGAGAGSGCVVPQGATGDDALLDLLFKLDGFDSEAFAAAMSSTRNARFVCWRRDESVNADCRNEKPPLGPGVQ